MTRNVTFSVEEHLLELARETARAEGSSLNEQFRLWLEAYVHKRQAERAMQTLAELQERYRITGPRPTRDEMNERR